MAVDARFIGGSGRSGTSLLAERIARHPDVVYFQEPFWFCDKNRQLLAYLRGEVDQDEFKRTMARSLRNVQTGFQEQGDTGMLRRYRAKGILADCESVVNGTMPVMDVRAYLTRFAEVSGRRYWIEKTPHNVRNADAIIDVFPDARIVHVIREPKDVCASIINKDWGPLSVDGTLAIPVGGDKYVLWKRGSGFVGWYKQIMEQALRAYEAVPREQYLVVEMEDLVRTPHREFGRVLRFLDIDYDLNWLHDTVKDIDLREAHIGRWYYDLSIAAQRYIDAHCKELYEQWRKIANG